MIRNEPQLVSARDSAPVDGLQQSQVSQARASLRGSQTLDVSEAVLALLCLLATGAFIYAHLAEPRFWLPAAGLHLWLIAALAVAVARFVRKAGIQLDGSSSAVQGQIEAAQSFGRSALRPLLISGILVWGAPFGIVAARAWLGWDLYAAVGGQGLLAGMAVAALAIGVFLLVRLSRNSAG